MQFQTVYEAASGPSHVECAFIARRFDAMQGYVPGESESLIVTSRLPAGAERPRMATQIGTRGHYTGVWRSMDADQPVLWACARRGWVGHLPVDAPAGSKWNREKLETQPLGMTGIDDGPLAGVYVWGVADEKRTLHQRAPGMSAFASMAHPAIPISVLTGTGELLFAVGGGAARFVDGSWTELRVDADSPLVAAAVGRGKLYAATEDGIFLAGDHALEEVARLPSALPGDIRAIARWQGATWIAAGRLGLWRLDDGESTPVCVRDDCDPRSLDARENLVFATTNLLASTADGETFKAAGKDFVLEARGEAPLGVFTG